MNLSESDIPGALLNGRLPVYESYWPRFDATRFKVPSANEYYA